MRILVVEDLASSDGGGAERSMGYLCSFLSEKHSLFLVYQREGNWVTDPQMAKWFKFSAPISTETFRQIGVVRWVKALNALVRICRKNNIDVIISHEINSLFTLRVLSMITGIPVKYYFKWISSKPNPGKLTSWGIKGLYKAAFVSSFIQKYWINVGIPEKKTLIIREGVESVSFRNNSAGELTKLIFAGRIIPDKGLHLVIEALGILKRQGIGNLQLLVCGYFNSKDDHQYRAYHREIEKIIADYTIQQNIVFAGFVKPLSEYIAKSDLAVLPSICQEASPLVILEALSVGTPIISSCVGGVPELLLGFEQLIFEPDNVEAITGKIKEVKDYLERNPEKRSELSLQMKSRFDSEFSKEKSLSNLEAFIIND